MFEWDRHQKFDVSIDLKYSWHFFRRVLSRMQFLNIAGYQFVQLTDLAELKNQFKAVGDSLQLKGTILLSREGINVSLSAQIEQLEAFKTYLTQLPPFTDMTFSESFSSFQAFKRFKIKIKKEIITMRREEIHPEEQRAPSISPETFKQWLDENRDMTVLDTRNDYEVQFGTFERAVHLQMKDFSEFPQKANEVKTNKPVVMFCTGGIRCEKAALHLIQEGLSEVYQLEGGILNYFAKSGGTHYKGDCFVFDGRVALNSDLEASDVEQCKQCRGPVRQSICSCING